MYFLTQFNTETDLWCRRTESLLSPSCWITRRSCWLIVAIFSLRWKTLSWWQWYFKTVWEQNHPLWTSHVLSQPAFGMSASLSTPSAGDPGHPRTQGCGIRWLFHSCPLELWGHVCKHCCHVRVSTWWDTSMTWSAERRGKPWRQRRCRWTNERQLCGWHVPLAALRNAAAGYSKGRRELLPYTWHMWMCASVDGLQAGSFSQL